MNTVSAADAVALHQWRYAVKAFDPSKTIPTEQWAALEQTLVLAPSSFGLQPWKFIVVEDAAIREELIGAAWGQRQVVDGSHFVVFAIKSGLNADDVDRHIARACEIQSAPKESLDGLRKMIVGFLGMPGFDVDAWSAKQVYIALGNFMTTAAAMGIDTCPMEGINPPKIDELLGLEGTGYKTVVACGAGYRSADDKYAERPKVRFAAEDVIQRV